MTGVLIRGWLLNGTWASSTMSFVKGGSWAPPCTATQFPGFSQALLSAPVQRTTFRSSEIVHRPVILVKALCSTQLSVASLAVLPDNAQSPPKCQRLITDSDFPLSHSSS